MDESVTFRPTAPRLMDQVRETLRFYHYAYNTEKSYVEWILKFIRFNGKKHPREMGKFEIERFLSHLAVKKMLLPQLKRIGDRPERHSKWLNLTVKINRCIFFIHAFDFFQKLRIFFHYFVTAIDKLAWRFCICFFDRY